MTSFPPSARSRRLLAAIACALVVALAVFAASPRLHAWLHANGPDHDETTCVVGLFGNGIALPLGSELAVLAPLEWRESVPARAAELQIPAPRYLRMPERGPPGA